MAVTPCGNNDNGFFGGEGIWAVIIFALIFGWGRGNGGLFGGSNGGAQDGYVLQNDFATIQRQLSDGFNSIDNALDAQNTGICNLGYTQLELTNGINTNLLQSTNALNGSIKDVGYSIATTGSNIQRQIADCCCENEKLQLQNKFDFAQANCATLQAIDKVGDRIIDYMSNEKTQALRDENQALRLSASQQMQNNYLISQLRPSPIPAYTVANPYCNCNAGYIGNGYYGTTIA